MTAVARIYDEQPDDELAKLSSVELRERLVKLLGLTQEALAQMAQIVRVLEDRGEDTDDLGIPIMPLLRAIAYGQCLPETVVRFSAARAVLSKVKSLPLPDQKRLADGQLIDLVVYDDAGNVTKRKADPLLMTPEQVRQVFAHDHIRSEAEQILLLDEQRVAVKRNRPTRVEGFDVDHERGGVVVRVPRGTFIPLETLRAAVNSLR